MNQRADARDQILHPGSRALMDLLSFTALGRLGLGFTAVGVLRARRPTRLEALGGFSCRPTATTGCPGTLNAAGDRRNHPREGDDIPGRPGRLVSQIPAILILGDRK
jgi:hypothetical protein